MPEAEGSQSLPPSIMSQQEVRLAVVMYGGISLAIYMNGVTQEMLRLVRATAPAQPGGSEAMEFKELKGSERVYRKLGQILRRGKPPLTLADDAGYTRLVNAASPILTRFVIDVISGTSAGGINGVFLAKALANDQGIDQLKQLWVKTGDFGELLNDKRRRRGTKPQSLLDGQFMYRELLKALEGMEGRGAPARADVPPASPYADEIDLYVTATDLVGLSLPIRLAGGVVDEPRHRNVFHFSYATGQPGVEAHNHFGRGYNPFLAFAARCTSSFPVAFEPMRLRDIDDTVNTVYRDLGAEERKPLLSGSPVWREFYPDYLLSRYESRDGIRPGGGDDGDPESAAAKDFVARAFADGGDLDNKPFGYAAATLLRRRSDVPVDRKLVFVDPDPQSPLDQAGGARDVDVLQNTLFALSPSVSTETIREDIQRINDRNRLIERIQHFVDGAENDVLWRNSSRGDAEATPAGRDDDAVSYATTYLDRMVVAYGAAYGGYHRVKVAALTDELARIIVRAANFGEDSDEFTAVRELVRAWRDRTYSISEKESEGHKKLPQSRFLLDFDLDYRLRRLGFLRSKIDELTCVGDEGLEEKLRLAFGDKLPKGLLTRTNFADQFRAALHGFRPKLGRATDPLLRAQSPYLRRGKANPLRDLADAAGGAGVDLLDPKLTGVTVSALRHLLDFEAGESRARQADMVVGENTNAGRVLDDIARRLAGDFKGEVDRAHPEGDFKKAIIASSRECGEILGKMNSPLPGAESPADEWARAALRHYYDDYHLFDQVIFPVMYETGVGEVDVVEIVRVSPYDAGSLISELAADVEEHGGRRGRRKLGGTAFGHFGAFLKREWRVNDILWGRLDAAETLICTFLPGDALKGQRDALIREAQQEILREELLLDGQKQQEVRARIIGLLLEASAADSPDKEPDALKSVRRDLETAKAKIEAGRGKGLGDPPFSAGAVKNFFESCANPDELVSYFAKPDGYEVDRRLDPQVMVRLMARSSRVFGGMLESLAEARRVDARRVAWVTRLAQVFWGVVEVAVPGNLPNLLFRHFVKLLYAFEAFVIVGGVLLVDAYVQRFGLIALAVTAGAHLLVTALGDYMSGRRSFLHALVRAPAALFAGAILVSAWLGLGELRRYWGLLSGYVARLPLLRQLHPLTPEVRTLALFFILALAVSLIAWALGGGLGAWKRLFARDDPAA
jgi:patatin-related protein